MARESAPAPWATTALTARLLRREAEDGLLIYEPWSGQTQLLSPLAGYIIDTLEQQNAPLETAELLRRVRAEASDTPPEQAEEELLSTLSELADAGLIEASGVPS